MIELRHLRTLCALRDTGSLVEAADRLHLSQSALSHQIRDFESRVGMRLFTRKSSPIAFTSAGIQLLRLADDILPQIRNTERELSLLASGSSGRLHIAIECHSCFEWLMPTLNAYRTKWPDIELDLASGFSFAPLPALNKGELDLVITSNPKPIKGITYLPLFRYEAIAAISNSHPYAHKPFLLPQDFTSQTLITYPVDQDMLDVFVHFLHLSDIEPANIRQAELTLMMVQLVASGRGICVLPNWALYEYSRRGDLSTTSLGEAGVWCTLYAAVRSDQIASHSMQDFWQIAKQTSAHTLNGILASSDDPLTLV